MKLILKAFMCIVTITAVILTLVSSGEANNREIRVYVDGVNVDFVDAKPYINIYNRTLVPVRILSEAVGATVDWDQVNQKVTIKKDNNTVILTVNSKNYRVNGVLMQMDSEMVLDAKLGRNFLPIRFVLEGLGAEVDWEIANNIGIIHVFTMKQTNLEKEFLKKMIIDEMKYEKFSPIAIGEYFNMQTFPIDRAQVVQSASGKIFTVYEAYDLAKAYLQLVVNYDGTSQSAMDIWEKEMLALTDEVSKTQIMKNNILSVKQKMSGDSLFDIDNIEIGNRFIVHAIVEGYCQERYVLYKIVLEIVPDKNNPQKITIINTWWTGLLEFYWKDLFKW